MLLARIAETSTALAATSSRLAKGELIAAVLRDAEPHEIELVAGYLAGALRQRRTGVGWASLVDAPAPADTPTLTVTDADAAFEALAAVTGAGSATARSAAVGRLFGQATEAEQRLLRGLISGELRQGALDASVQEGAAKAFEVPVAAVRRAAMLLGSTPGAVRTAAGTGLAGLEATRLAMGVPLQPMLAASAPDAAAAAVKAGLPALVDAKLDGIRVQVHRNGHRVRIFTRSLDDITERLPEVVEVVAALPVEAIVLDGEVVGLAPDGRPLPFQVIASRTASSLDVQTARRTTPLSLFCFDLLHLDGIDLLDEPLRVRADELARVVPAALIVPRRLAHTAAEVVQAFTEAVAAGYEGAVVKTLTAPYAAGRRDSGWVKVKPRHTFDLAVTAAEWGHGRRQGWLSNLHLAARDAHTGDLVMLGKTFKGLTDALLTWQTGEMLARESRRTTGTVYLDPPLVVEIACDGIQRSPRYPGGVALRFARVLRYREDKTVEEIDTLDTVKELGEMSEADE